ncbi:MULTISPECIES: ImmA/IrrE family metallo-endopeptidase [unclassified Pseudoalteromonas]|jgi:Zn-dependent peptidase ImmA (M78 family)/DNA-binding XRE family transcriptional regulator|uniref:helix-turn-helix domain-containing protein n=1 Tax=unclassified Pseudoalteromonas TaxID=194690 RepID=UPI001602A172|nr:MULTISPECIES: XRE family transcriptional regulator [unclassified Pseudoalteromonas]MBB1351219.1 ImmA/IrrE family metallo-endopeptidase [Pseudoalteromonas sp. SG45-3]MBB1358679.1 ImmA/IrrE family metallo-endopeptidase [Pseudoalteromonas sp. SG45-6]
MFAERFTRARKASGLSMQALATAVGVSANAIKKYEHGTAMPSSSNLLKLASALEVRTEYFFRPIKVKLEGVEYRKRASTPQKILDRINGDVLDQAERWQELLNFYPDSIKPITPFSLPSTLPDVIDSYEQLEGVATTMRNEWGLGLNPIHDMIDTLESKGVMIICTDVETSKKFDGLAGNINGLPVVVISTAQSGDRQRFTLAHELGHLVLHNRLSEELDEEKACNHFAGAFLLPSTSLIQHLGKSRTQLEAQELYMLKHEYGISMLASLFRASQSGVISYQTQKNMFIWFGKQGWRTQEPGKPYPHEITYLYKQLVYRALSEDYIGISKAAELLGVSLSSFHKERKLEVLNAAAAN